MTESRIYPIPESMSDALISPEKYAAMYKASIEDPESFWGEQARQRLDWIKPFSKVKDVSFARDDLHIRWFEDGELNVAANCIDRHLEERGDQTAIIWEGDDPETSRHISYRELHEQVCRLANALKNQGVGKGDRVTLYMPMIPEAAYAMLACAPNRCDSFGGIRRVFSGFASGQSHRRLPVQRGHYRRRKRARRQIRAAEGQRRQGTGLG